MSRAAVNRMAGPMLVFLGLSTIGASAMLVPILSARRAGGSVQRGPLADGAVDDGATMVRCLVLSMSSLLRCRGTRWSSFHRGDLLLAFVVWRLTAFRGLRLTRSACLLHCPAYPLHVLPLHCACDSNACPVGPSGAVINFQAHLRGLAIQQQQHDVDQRRGVEGVASPTGAVPALPPPRS